MRTSFAKCQSHSKLSVGAISTSEGRTVARTTRQCDTSTFFTSDRPWRVGKAQRRFTFFTLYAKGEGVHLLQDIFVADGKCEKSSPDPAGR